MLLVHDPVSGVYGDCFRACVASIIELPTEAVPHIFFDGHEPPEAPAGVPGLPGWHRLNSYLARLPVPLHALGFKLPDAEALEQWNISLSEHIDAHYVLGGFSVRACHHAVVGRRGQVVHDPHPTRAGLLLDRFPMDLVFLVRR